jgi:glycosyltransferase domain-containing protein
MLSEVTIVVPLKDRTYETEAFMHHSVIPDVRYLFLDGSSDGQNEVIVKRGMNANTEYHRLAPDLNIDVYVDKMASGMKLVRTPYVMMADNDDVVLEGGLTAAVKVLNADSKSVFAGGDIVGFLRAGRDRNRVSWPKTNVDASKLHGKEGLEAINQSRLDWRHLWYSVFRTDVLKWCWNEIQESRVRDPYLIEFLLCDLPFCKGRYAYTGVSQYMRLQNQTERAIATLGFRSVELGRQPKSWWTESEVGDEVLASHLGVDPSAFESQFHRAAAVAGKQGSSLRPLRLLKDVGVRASDRATWLSLDAAIRLTSSGKYRLIPLRDSSAR